MQKKERKQRVRKTPPLLPRLVILFFLLMVLLFMNIDMCSRILNYGSYEKTTATIVAKKTDGFLLLIPMAELSYQYEGNFLPCHISLAYPMRPDNRLQFT